MCEVPNHSINRGFVGLARPTELGVQCLDDKLNLSVHTTEVWLASALTRDYHQLASVLMWEG